MARNERNIISRPVLHHWLIVLSSLVAVALVALSQTANGRDGRVAFYAAASWIILLASYASRWIWAILVDAFQHPTVHTRIEQKDGVPTVRVIDHRDSAGPHSVH